MALQATGRSDLKDVGLEELRARALAQELSFARWEGSDDAAGVELFRRAIVEQDETAWRAVIEVYRSMLAARAGRRALRGLVVEDDGFCVDRAFQRFWLATRRSSKEKNQFDDLGSILKYLKMCLASVLLDEARARRRQSWVPLEEVSAQASRSADPEERALGRMARRELWEAIAHVLQDPNERLIAKLSFVAGLSPREILARHPERFTDVFEVYRAKRNMIDRLRRSEKIHGRLHGPGDDM